MDALNTWLGYIVSEIINTCININLQNCPGCRDGMISPLLHFHTSLSLKDIIETYFSTALTCINIDVLYKNFCSKMNIGDCVNSKELLSLGHSFLRTVNEKAVYYGDYITTENDKIVSDALANSALSANIVTQTNCTAQSYEPSYEPTSIPKKKIVRKRKNTSKIESKSKTANNDLNDIIENYDPSSPTYSNRINYEILPNVIQKTPRKKKNN